LGSFVFSSFSATTVAQGNEAHPLIEQANGNIQSTENKRTKSNRLHEHMH
jgi:hypothetical protein